MSEQNEAQDATNKKSTARPIGGIGNMRQYATIGGKHPDVQKSESLDTQTSSISDVQESKSPNVKKSKHPDWKQQTIYLPPELAMTLKMQAVLDGKEISEIVTEALTSYLPRRPAGRE